MKEHRDISPRQDLIHELLEGQSVFVPVEPSPFLEAKIMRRLDAEMQGAPHVRASTWRLRLAGLALLFAVNAFSFVFLTRPASGETAAPLSIADTYWSHEQEIISSAANKQ